MPVANAEQIDVNVVGSSTFGIFPKISLEKSYNFYISDEWMVNYPGFKKIVNIIPNGEGRGLFNSIRGGFIVVVISSTVYRLDTGFAPIFVGNIATDVGDVSIDENLVHQICIVDGQAAYIYNYELNSFIKQVLTITPLEIPPAVTPPPYIMTPNYVCYHNTFFLFGSAPSSPFSSAWCAFRPTVGDGTTISFVTQSQFFLQTKPDVALAVERLPGKSNHVLVLGSTVAEVWTNVGTLQNYTRVSSFSIDYGLVATSTLAASEDFICWLGQNENNAPSVMLTNGATTERISTDGIDNVLSSIQFPAQSTAFFFRQDGHLFYQLTFYNPVDNLSLFYDFTTKRFFHTSDENLNFHPARKIVFFNEATYFVSLNDGDLYQIGSNFVTYDYDTSPTSIGEEIPRIRICKTICKKDSSRFRIGQFTFWIEQGMPNLASPIPPRVDMSFSKNGNQSFSNVVGRELNPSGIYQNQIRWWQMGQANEFTIQLRFWGFTRMVVKNGVVEAIAS